MKVVLVLPLTLLTSVVLVGFVKIRKKEHDKQDKQIRFQDIKLRVTSDVLVEYENEKAEKQNQLGKTQNDLKTTDEDLNILQVKAEKSKEAVDQCQGAKKSDADQLALAETNLNSFKAESEKEMADLRTEIEAMQKQLAEHSAVCNFLKEKPDPIKEMCGIKEEPPKQEEKKEEPPKQEEKKEEPPKQEEKKEEPPKQEEKKEEPPKQEEKKEEPPKQEEKKDEPPKQEEKKEEPPKQEEKKEEPPKQEEKKEEPPKQEEQKAEGQQ